METELLSLLAL